MKWRIVLLPLKASVLGGGRTEAGRRVSINPKGEPQKEHFSMAFSIGAACYPAFLRPKRPFPQSGVDFETELQRRSPSRPIFGQLSQVHGSLAPGSIPGQGRAPGEGTGYPLQCSWASLVAQMVKNQPAMWET